MMSDIAVEIYDNNDMSDKERFILLMGSTDMIVFYQLSNLLNLHLNHL